MCISVSVCTVCITVSPLPAGCSCCGWTMNSSTATPPYMPPRCTILHNTEQYCTILHIRRAAPSTILLLMLHRQSVAQQIHHNSIQQPPPSHVLDQHIHKTNALGAMLKKSIATREHWTSHCKGALLSQIWLDWIKSQLYLWHCRLGCWTGRCAHCTVTGYCTVYSAHCAQWLDIFLTQTHYIELEQLLKTVTWQGVLPIHVLNKRSCLKQWLDNGILPILIQTQTHVLNNALHNWSCCSKQNTGWTMVTRTATGIALCAIMNIFKTFLWNKIHI